MRKIFLRKDQPAGGGYARGSSASSGGGGAAAGARPPSRMVNPISTMGAQRGAVANAALKKNSALQPLSARCAGGLALLVLLGLPACVVV